MLDLWDRWIQFHELHLKREPEHAPQIDLGAVIPHLIERVRRAESVKKIKNDTAAIRIQEARMYPRERAVVFLMQYADMNVSDPAFQGLDSGNLRVEHKLDGEGIATSNHVAVSLVPKEAGMPLYPFLIEEVPGLTRSNIAPFLKSELKIVADGLFEFADEAENGRVRKSLPAAEIESIASVTLRDELDGGSLINEIELISHEPKGKRFDEAGSYREKERSIVLKVESNDGILGKLRDLKDQARKDGYGELKLRYKKSGGKQKTALIGTTKGDVADSLLGRSEMVTSDEVLAQCRETICTSIANKMVAFIARTED